MEADEICPFGWNGFSVNPPPPAALLEEDREWWGKYPEDLTQGFSASARPSDLHQRTLPAQYFPVLGRVPKKFNSKNRRHLDMSVAQFENDTTQVVDRSKWGLTVPNVDAAFMSLSRYAKSVPVLDDKRTIAINMAFDWMTRHFGPHMQNSRVQTLDEVVPKLDMSTSPGFPWTRKYAKKVDLLEQRPDFLGWVAVDWDRLLDPNYVAIFGCSLKEEVRPQEKLDLNKQRTFTAGPIEMTLHGNRLFQDMNQKFYDSHLQTASVVGFSTQHLGWDTLYRKLASHPKGYATDGKEYDSSLRRYLMWGCAKFRWEMLRSEDQTEEVKIRIQNYYANLINTIIITSEGIFVRKTTGNPSGSVNTISDNTLILYVLLAFAWIMLAPANMCNYKSFDENVSLALCGDDNTWTVSERANVFYNATTVIDVWKTIGITGTSDTMEPRAAEELDFLSAHTVFYKGFAIPLYEREKLLTSLLYSREPGNPSLTLTRASAFLRVGWADAELRKYLKEIISWLVLKYGPVLCNTPEWRAALASIPTNDEIEYLFISESYPMEQQSIQYRCTIKEINPGLKSIMRPQRPRTKRVPKAGLRKIPFPKQRKQQPRRAQRPAVRRRRAGGGGGGMGPMRATMPRGRGVSQVMKTERMTTNYPFHGKEFIADILSNTGAYTNVVYAINPGQASTFPWLNKEALLYEKYMFTSLQFSYLTETNEFATVAVGKVILAVDYDASDSPPSTKNQVENSEPNATCAPYQNCVLSCRPSDINGSIGWHYVRPAGLPGASDIKTYDCGNLNVGVSGNGGSNGTKIGELWVRYAGVFKDRVLESVTTAPANNSVSVFTSVSAGETPTTTVPLQLALANAANINGLAIVNTAGSMVPPAGNFLVDLSVTASSSVAITELEILFEKNAGLIPGYGSPEIAFTAGATNLTIADSYFVTANGTDAFTFNVLEDASGTLNASGNIRWFAV